MKHFIQKLAGFIFFLVLTIISFHSKIMVSLTISSVLLGMSFYVLFTDKLFTPSSTYYKFWKLFIKKKPAKQYKVWQI